MHHPSKLTLRSAFRPIIPIGSKAKQVQCNGYQYQNWQNKTIPMIALVFFLPTWLWRLIVMLWPPALMNPWSRVALKQAMGSSCLSETTLLYRARVRWEMWRKLWTVASEVTAACWTLATVKVNDSATIQSDDSTGNSSGELGSDPESTESTPELIQAILDRHSSCSIYSSMLLHRNIFIIFIEGPNNILITATWLLTLRAFVFWPHRLQDGLPGPVGCFWRNFSQFLHKNVWIGNLSGLLHCQRLHHDQKIVIYRYMVNIHIFIEKLDWSCLELTWIRGRSELRADSAPIQDRHLESPTLTVANINITFSLSDPLPVWLSDMYSAQPIYPCRLILESYSAYPIN